MTTDDDKKFLMSFLRTVKVISDKKYQGRIWIRGEGPEVDDFDETVCFFFDDVEEIIEKFRQYGLTKSQYQMLRKFRDKFEDFVDNREHYLPEDFIDTLWWQEIIDLAKNLLKAFSYQEAL